MKGDTSEGRGLGKELKKERKKSRQKDRKRDAMKGNVWEYNKVE